ncbi:hypothetical protein BgiBS90_019574, partial [Biomphalaria glabrata]
STSQPTPGSNASLYHRTGQLFKTPLCMEQAEIKTSHKCLDQTASHLSRDPRILP